MSSAFNRSDKLRPGSMPGGLRWLMGITDLGFLLYWGMTALHLLPEAWLFKDYHQPILVAWNWSFLPLDLLASLCGLLALAQLRRHRPWQTLSLFSLCLTCCAGLQAISFWFLRGDFDLSWWLPNLFLLIWPLPYLAVFVLAASLAERGADRSFSEGLEV